MARRGRRRGWLNNDRAIIISAIISLGSALGVSVSTPTLTDLLNDDPPRLSRSCVEIQVEYADAIRRDPGLRELILPGADGKSSLSADPEAQACGLTPEIFEPLSDPQDQLPR
jgi:hypothetical protein